MKSLLITVLSLALLAAAFFTRPNPADFKELIVREQAKSDSNVLKKAVNEELAKRYVENCTFNDRYLWVDVKNDGKTVYTGAFAHWFNRADVKADLQKVEQKSKNKLDELQQKLPDIEKKSKDTLDKLTQQLPKAS